MREMLWQFNRLYYPEVFISIEIVTDIEVMIKRAVDKNFRFTFVLTVPYLMVSFTGSGAPLTLIRNSSSKCPRMPELNEIWTAWTPLGSMMPSLGLKTKQAPKADVGGITLKRASMLPLLDSTACISKRQRGKGQGICDQFACK